MFYKCVFLDCVSYFSFQILCKVDAIYCSKDSFNLNHSYAFKCLHLSVGQMLKQMHYLYVQISNHNSYLGANVSYKQ